MPSQSVYVQVKVTEPSHAGGVEMTGPVDIIVLPQLSVITGGTGAEAALAQATVPLVGAMAGNGLISIVTVLIRHSIALSMAKI